MDNIVFNKTFGLNYTIEVNISIDLPVEFTQKKSTGFGNWIQVKGHPFTVHSVQDWWWIPERLR